MPDIVKLNKDSPYSAFDEVAQIHSLEIHHGTLPKFGNKFLSRLYRELASISNTGVWIAVNSQNEILGFLAGCANTSHSYLSVIKHAGLPLGLLAIKGLMRPSMLINALSLLTYPFYDPAIKNDSPHPELIKAELLAIAVHPRAQRGGIGKTLVQAFELGLKSWGIKDGYCVATNIEEDISNSFYRTMGFKPYYLKKHNNLILQVYQKQIENDYDNN